MRVFRYGFLLALFSFSAADSVAAADVPRHDSANAAGGTRWLDLREQLCERRDDGSLRCVPRRTRLSRNTGRRIAGGAILGGLGLSSTVLGAILVANADWPGDGEECHAGLCSPAAASAVLASGLLVSAAGGILLGRGVRGLRERRSLVRDLRLLPFVMPDPANGVPLSVFGSVSGRFG